jgi:hypothetical protein
MNQETARHLNALRAAAAEVTFEVEEVRLELNGPHTPALCRQIEAAVNAMGPEAQRQEIVEAASERTEAGVAYDTMIGSNWVGDYACLRGRVGYRAALLAREQIVAIISAHNAATASAYEAYRLACEQGVAVPPQDD